MYFSFFLSSRILETSLNLNNLNLQNNWYTCFEKSIGNDVADQKCESFTGGFLNVFVSIFDVNNTIFTFVILFSKKVEDYIASFS